MKNKIVSLPNQNLAAAPSIVQEPKITRLKYKNMELSVHPQGAKVLEFKVDQEDIVAYDPKNLKRSGIPICFPIFGPITEPLKIGDKTYKMGQHGFLRDSDFILENQTKNSATYSLTSNPETLKQYPFNFKFTITYTLKNNSLQIKANLKHLKVAGVDKETKMPFVLAFHPYFTVENPEKIQINTLSTKYYDNLLPENKHGFVKATDLKDSKQFQNEFGNLTIQGAPDAHFINHILPGTTVNPGTNKYKIILTWLGLKNMTIWREKADAKYICVEPSTNSVDNKSGTRNRLDNALDKNQKQNIGLIPQGKSLNFSFDIKAVSTK